MQNNVSFMNWQQQSYAMSASAAGTLNMQLLDTVMAQNPLIPTDLAHRDAIHDAAEDTRV